MESAEIRYGRLLEGIESTNFNGRRVLSRLKELLEDGSWKHVNGGSDDPIAFIARLDLSMFSFDAPERKEIAQILKANLEVSNRAVAKALGVSKDTVRNDLAGDSSPPRVKQSSNGAAQQGGRGDFSPSEVEPEFFDQQADPEPEPQIHKPSPQLITLRTHEGREVQYPKPKAPATFNQTQGPGISWAKWSWNPVTGCLHGCRYCYAREIATSERTRSAFPVGFEPLFHEERLDAPINTTIPADHKDDPDWRRVFVCSMADLYGKWVPDEWIERVHGAMLAAPQWEYLLLTKFPRRYVGLKMPPNSWVGTSVDEQKRVRLAEDAFRQIKGVKVKWLSLEPLLAPLEFSDLSMFDWIVIGAQTETRQPDGVVPAFAPPFDWVARLRAQAAEAGVKVHLKDNLANGKPGMTLVNEYPV